MFKRTQIHLPTKEHYTVKNKLETTAGASKITKKKKLLITIKANNKIKFHKTMISIIMYIQSFLKNGNISLFI